MEPKNRNKMTILDDWHTTLWSYCSVSVCSSVSLPLSCLTTTVSWVVVVPPRDVDEDND